jgi:hypothetical protein
MGIKSRQIGQVKLTQLQPNGLIIDTPAGEFYDTSRLMVVDRLKITPLGIEATTPEGEHFLDIHHINHPGKAYDKDDLICIGFTSHYQAMRDRFGEHMVDGIAGENIIIEFEKEIWPEELSDQIAIENAETGQLVLLDLVRFAAPCSTFSHFAAQSQHEKLPAENLKAVLQFLGNGRRGFLFLLSDNQEEAFVQPGDKVFLIDA